MYICTLIEDKKLVHVCLPKSRNKSDNCWKALLKTGYEVDPVTYDQMEQKMTLERFQLEVQKMHCKFTKSLILMNLYVRGSN